MAAAAALIAGGWAVGAFVTSGQRTPSLGPVLPPPPGAQGQAPGGQNPPPGGPSLTGAQPGVPFIGLNQDFGDKNTGFMVHGQYWPVGRTVTIALLGVGVSPIHPVADRAGTFNYVINQDHEFFGKGLPPGIYTVKVTGADGTHAEARFSVRRT